MCDIETRVRDLREEIISCIKEPTIVSRLEAKSVISTEDGSRIKNLYLRDETYKAGEDLLECVLNSKEPGKWKSFLDALKSSDYQHLKALLLSKNNFDEFSAHAKTVMRLFTPYLEKIVIAKEIVSELRARDVINGTDEEVILAMFANKGDIYSTMVLLERMQCRVSPQKWYYVFLDVLMKKGHQEIVQEMEPYFIANPSSFMPPLDFEEGDTDTNDLGASPTPSVRQDSLITSQESIFESNFKELNIKPEMTKSLYFNSADPTGKEEARNEDSGDEDDSSSLDSDYENKEAETEAISAHTAAPLNLRKYQLELAENAILGRNTIICAETGSGKTWVALHIIQKHLQQTGNGPRKVVFMARTGALIRQQSDRFKAYLPEFQTKLITGDDESRLLDMFVENYDILCFTPQILVNNLEDNVIKSLSEFSLLILDECHHTRGEGPYSKLMRKYLVEKVQTTHEMPQVVGLTASIGVGKSRTDMEAVEYILRVCACLDVRLLSTVERNLPELKKQINMPDEETIQLVEQRDDPCKHEIMTAMEQTEDMLQDNFLMQAHMIDLMDKQPRNRESQEYNKWTVDVMKAALLKVYDYEVSRDISSCAKYLNTYNSALEVNKLLLAKDVIKYLAEKLRQEGENKSKLTEMERTLYSNLQAIQKTMNVKGKNTENPNVRILSDTLRKMLEEKGDASRAMVFVKARATCRSLATFLDKDLKNSGISASPLYGKENRGGDDGMTESQQTEILEKFREGFFKVLVCTSVGNEGIDIPDCNIVLSYEYSGDEITKIQMKGRARKKEATTTTMGSDKVVEQERINAYKASMMYRALKRVKELDPKYFSMKVTAFQKEETHKYRFKAEVEKLKKGRKSDEDFEILCGRCNTFACYVSDVRQLGHHHIVIDKTFGDKITRKEHKKPKTYDGLHKKFKMFCKKCPSDWGIIGIRGGLDCMILKIMNFKFRNLRTRGVSTYKKWIDMPYNVPGIRLEDLPRLLVEDPLPEEILKMDDSSISLYLEALKDGTTKINTIRVMIVGHCGVGKTTLTRRLFGEHVDVMKGIERTNGIEVHVKRCKVQLPEAIWLPLAEGDSQENYNNRIASVIIKSSEKAKSDQGGERTQLGQTDKSMQNLPTEQLPEHLKSDKASARNSEEETVDLHKHDSSVHTMNQNVSRLDVAPYSYDVHSHEQRIRMIELVNDINCSTADYCKEDNTADLSVWDFAGQHVFYGTHQVFLSKRAVYLLVTDLSGHVDNIVDDECFIDSNGETRCKISDFVTFWLNSIHSYCGSERSGGPPVILIGTFADKLDKEKKQELADNFFKTLREVLAHNAHNAVYDNLVCNDFTIDNSVKDPNVELLKKKIVQVAAKQRYWNKLYPSRWVLLERSLVEFKKQGMKILRRKVLEETNTKLPVPIQSTNELDLFLRFHHETGFILYFSDDSLKDYILLEPQWLVDALKSLITARQFCEKKASFLKTWLDYDRTALLKWKLIDAVWEVGTPFHEHKALILDYMEKLGIIARPRQNLQCGSMEDFYIAPCVLKQTVPDRLLEFSVGDCESTSRLCFSTASKIMPVQVFHKLIADCITRWPISQQKSTYQIFCGCCVFDVDNLHMLYVYFRDSVIQIWITKYSKIEPEPDINVCIAVKEFVEQHLHNTLRGSCELETYVKCPHANIKLPDHWWKVDELSKHKEVKCNSHDPCRVLSTSELMKYWDHQYADQIEEFPETFFKSIPKGKQLSQMAQRIGKEYRSLGLVLGLSEVQLDHLEMGEQRHTPADKITAMLSTWVKLKSPNATFGELKNAMSCISLDWMTIFKGL